MKQLSDIFTNTRALLQNVMTLHPIPGDTLSAQVPAALEELGAAEFAIRWMFHTRGFEEVTAVAPRWISAMTRCPKCGTLHYGYFAGQTVIKCAKCEVEFEVKQDEN